VLDRRFRVWRYGVPHLEHLNVLFEDVRAVS
jgi:hypothetical protein